MSILPSFGSENFMNRQLTRTAATLAVPITMAVTMVFGAGAYAFLTHYSRTLRESTRGMALGQGEVIREALKRQMLDKDPALIRETVRGLADRAGIESLAILDHQGRVWFSSDSASVGDTFSEESPVCGGCHEEAEGKGLRNQTFETRESSLLRVVLPLENEESCRGCHDPAQSLNGLLVLDKDISVARAAMARDLRWMVVGSGLLVFLLVGSVAGIIQLLVLRRLHRFETAARRIAGGDLDRRVPTTGSDTISWLGREFNSMADSVTGLLREVRQQRERLETVINSIDDGIVVLDPNRRIIAANASFLQRTGHSREEVLGCGCTEVAKGACNTSDCPTLACLASGEHQVRICNRKGPNGVVAWEEVHSSPVLGPTGEILQVVEVWRDISQRRAAEARLAESHRLASLGMLASGFSHEMSTPLATVLTCVEGILRETRTNGDRTTTVRHIEESAALAREQIMRARGITRHFLQLSRGQSSPGDLMVLEDVVQAVIRLVEPTASAKGIKVRSASIPSRLRVRANGADLEHALINLLLNAVDACEPGGNVEVDADGDGSRVHVRVRDDGCGIPAEHMDRIFEPFVSLRENGTGLGLFLALNFVRQWDGDIRVRSVPGDGTEFEVVLPLAGDPSAVEVST